MLFYTERDSRCWHFYQDFAISQRVWFLRKSTVLIPQFAEETRADGTFVRQQYTIRDRLTADGSSGFKAEPGRYHLYVSLACPWAHRSILVRKLLGQESVISMSVV